MDEKLLVIDDEPHILRAIERVFADQDIQVLSAANPRQGLEILSRGEIAVLVTDNMMPGMDGLEVLRRAKVISPDTVRIMLTGHASLDTAIAAINLGEVFRFVLKPWDNDEFVGIVNEAVQRYRIVNQLRSGDEGVMLSIAQAIELKDSYTRGHCDRVADYAQLIGQELGLSAKLLQEIRYGSWLHDCGKIGVTEKILNSPSSLDEEEYTTVKKHCLWGAELARLARLSETIINVILYHHEHFDGNGYPIGLAGDKIPLEARIVAVADAYDALTSERPYRVAYTSEKALGLIGAVVGSHYDPEIFSIFSSKIHAGQKKPKAPDTSKITTVDRLQ